MMSTCTSKKNYILETIISLLVLVLILLCFFPCIEYSKNNWSAEAMDYISTITTQDGNPILIVILGCTILIGVWVKRLIFSWMGMVASIITIGNSFRLYAVIVIDEILSQIQYFFIPGDGTYNDIGTPTLTPNGYAVVFIPIVILVLYIICLIREISIRKNVNKQRSEQDAINSYSSIY